VTFEHSEESSLVVNLADEAFIAFIVVAFTCTITTFVATKFKVGFASSDSSA